jgi:hypothetical protein
MSKLVYCVLLQAVDNWTSAMNNNMGNGAQDCSGSLCSVQFARRCLLFALTTGLGSGSCISSVTFTDWNYSLLERAHV